MGRKFNLAVAAASTLSVLLFTGCATEKISTRPWNSYNKQAKASLDKHDLTQADRLYALALQEAEQFGPGRKLSYSLGKLSGTRFALQNYSEAERLALRRLEINQKIMFTNTLEFANELSFLAQCQDAQGKFDKAEQNYSLSEEIAGGLLPRQCLAPYIARRARLYTMQERYILAEATYEIAKGRFETWILYLNPVSAQHSYVLNQMAGMLNDYGLLCLRQQNHAKAEDLLQQSLNILAHQSSKSSIRIVPTLNNLARVYAARKDFQKALSNIQRAAAIAEKELPAGDVLRTQTLKMRDDIMRQSASADS